MSAFDVLAEELATTDLAEVAVAEMDLADLFVVTGLAKSKGELRRNAKGYYVNQVSLEGRDLSTGASTLSSEALRGTFLLLQRGRNTHHLVRLQT